MPPDPFFNPQTAAKKLVATPAQEAVISHREGPMIVVSGAGSGKTTVLALRVEQMLNEGYQPRMMLILTFGRKAAQEIITRLSSRVSAPELSAMIQTYHGFGWRFLRRFPGVCERQAGVQLLDVLDSRRVFSEAAGRTELASDIKDRAQATKMLRLIQGQYSLLRNDSISAPHELAERLRQRLHENSDLPSFKIDRAVRTALEYEVIMKARNVVDFDHLLVLPARAVAYNPKAREWLQKRHPHLMVDESQDTNLAQYELVRQIGAHRNLVMVGDDDQVLFTWRGARAENLRRFIRDFNPKEVFLTQNWRSTQAIVRASASLIGNNTERIPKKPFSDGAVGSVPTVKRFANGYDMARGLSSVIGAAIEAGARPDSIAVLYRTNRMVRLLEGDLKRAGIPYRLVGNQSLFDAAEIRAVMGAVRIRANHFDESAYQRLTKFLVGVGETSITAAAGWASQQGVNPWTSADEPSFVGLPTRVAATARTLRAAIQSLEQYGPSRLGQWALAEDGLAIPSVMGGEAKAGDLRRITANLQLLDQVNGQAVDAMLQLAETNKLERADTWGAITDNMLSDAVPETPNEPTSKNVVTLSTIHRSKGLEWDTVYVAGASDNLMPLACALSDGDDEFSGGVEEERRLAFVALTRARQNCVFLHAEELFIPGMAFPLMGNPSAFIQEMEGVVIPPPASRVPDMPPLSQLNKFSTQSAPTP